MEAITQWMGIEITAVGKTFVALLLIVVLVITMAACPNFGDTLTKVTQIITAAAPAITLILQILPAFGVGIPPTLIQQFQVWEPQVQTDLAIVAGLLAEYKDAIGTAKTGLLVKIEAAVQIVQRDLASILPALHVVNQFTQQKIIALITSVSDAIQMVAAWVSATQGKVGEAKVKMAGVTSPVKDGKSFKSHFNNVLHEKTGDSSLDTVTAQYSLQ